MESRPLKTYPAETAGRSSAGEHRGGRRLYGHGPKRGFPGLDHFRHPGDGAARAHPADESVYIRAERGKDLRTMLHARCARQAILRGVF